MPPRYARGQRPALVMEAQESLRFGGPLLSFHTNFVVQPERDLLAAALWRHARI